MNFFVLGVNHKECPVEVREKLHFGAKQLKAALELSKKFPTLAELVILSTCNRVEFYGCEIASGTSCPRNDSEHVIARRPEADEAILHLIEKTHAIPRIEFQKYLYRHQGKEAIRHLFRVAAGLDSLVVGENEILGQVREAFRISNEQETVNSLLYRLMEKALKLGKDVRTQTKINEGAVSIPSVAVELAEKIFGKLSGEKVMVIGTGEMSELTLKNLKQAGAQVVYIVSRNQERGQELAAQSGAQWLSLENWEDCLARVDILITSTAAPHPIVHFEAVKRVMMLRRQQPLFLIDIAVPRDIEPEIHGIDNVYLYNVDDLKSVSAANLKRRSSEIRAAEERVEKAVLDYQSWIEQLKARPTLESFENFLDQILEQEIARFGAEQGTPEEKKRELRTRIRAKLLHPPLEKIKEASQNGGVTRYLEALKSLFNL